MRKHWMIIASLILSVGLLVGCDSNGVGPPGPPGPAGPPGGTIVRSFTVDFILNDATFNDPFATLGYDAPEVTRAAVDKGAVMAYFRDPDTATWTAMPYTFGVESPDLAAVDYTATLGYAYDVDYFEVFYDVSDARLYDTDVLLDQVVRVVVIEGDPAVNAGVDWSNYSDVKTRFGLDE